MPTLDQPFFILHDQIEQHHMQQISNECGSFSRLLTASFEYIWANETDDFGKSNEHSFQDTRSTDDGSTLWQTLPFNILKRLLSVECSTLSFSAVRGRTISSLATSKCASSAPEPISSAKNTLIWTLSSIRSLWLKRPYFQVLNCGLLAPSYRMIARFSNCFEFFFIEVFLVTHLDEFSCISLCTTSK